MAHIVFSKEDNPKMFVEVFSFRTTQDFINFYNLDGSSFGFFESRDVINATIDNLIDWICYHYTYQSCQDCPISSDIKKRTFNLLRLLFEKDKELLVSVWD